MVSAFLLIEIIALSNIAILFLLVRSDSTMKQFLLYLDDINELGDKFVYENLDETHLFINASFVDKLKEKIDDLMERLSYVPTEK